MIFNLYKERGETPLERIERFVKENPNLKDEKMTYLGRLDPLAEGVLLVGSGKDTSQSRREEFFGLDKEYDFVCIFGFATDTYDVLGKVIKINKLNLQQAHDENSSTIFENEVRKVVMIYEGKREQKYPEYSSKMINQRKSVKNQEKSSREQLSDRDWRESEGIFQQKNTPVARENLFLDSYEAPTKKITVYRMQFHKLETLNGKELFGRLLMDISKVKGDFRQNEILLLWKEIILKYPKREIFLGKFSAYVSSGTYIRSLVNDIGETLGCGATILSIKRTRVGDYKIENSIK
ncbi:MAG: tRNA pseudouridine synthase B [Parcubacteria group bacterium GW2011_GWB1_35_5]|nr:MAG: tRNA pseudouridine synthase B [Parcubacteria group bacterium GW2011_GWC1_34_10]KKP81130.1 MAG: tRNA pseudouridine synthase B [Parcubacteria group bacterium GW2011_GWB1_35_5]